MWWIIGLAAWLVCGAAVGVVLGKSVRLEERREEARPTLTLVR